MVTDIKAKREITVRGNTGIYSGWWLAIVAKLILHFYSGSPIGWRTIPQVVTRNTGFPELEKFQSN